ncbi:MAG: HAMP domain-containing histidine kinase [Ignavibacteriae bacterium]|nr:HAMP domain-containing histidine kinase [Ignavibacteriota bacterium]
MKETGALKKLFLILLLVVLLPALFYSGYELNTMSRSEELIATIYRQQLDMILFSLNQYALDVANNWASSIGILFNEHIESKPDSLKNVIEKFLGKNSAIQSLMFSDVSLTTNILFSTSGNRSLPIDTTLVQTLRSNKEKIERLLRYQQVEYRKLEPIEIESGNRNTSLALLFVTNDVSENQTVVTIVLDEQTFIREILSAKLREAATEEFVLAISKEGTQEPVYSTSPIQTNELKQNKQLWIFPNYYLGITLKGETIEELTQARFNRNLVLVLLLDVVLIAGVWIVYNNIRRQMQFVRLKSDFVSNVSHELRTPLSLIRMYAETLEMNRIGQEEKKREYYSTILQETERLTRLVNNILDFSKMEAGKKQYTMQETDLNEIVSALLDTYRFHLQSEGFELMIQLQSSLPPLLADKESISEAIANILDNAIKYSDSKKFVRITTGSNEKTTFLEIEDHGIGIATEHHKKSSKIFIA